MLFGLTSQTLAKNWDLKHEEVERSSSQPVVSGDHPIPLCPPTCSKFVTICQSLAPVWTLDFVKDY